MNSLLLISELRERQESCAATQRQFREAPLQLNSPHFVLPAADDAREETPFAACQECVALQLSLSRLSWLCAKAVKLKDRSWVK